MSDSSLKDGGPAFPFHCINEKHSAGGLANIYGMSLRDWFAGMAMQGIIEAGGVYAPDAETAVRIHKLGVLLWRAETAYEYADAMLKVREEDNAQTDKV